MPEQDRRIHSRELAEVMAYAEVPSRRAAKQVMEIPESEDYRDYFLSAAERDAHTAAKKYLGKLAANLGLRIVEDDPVLSTEIIIGGPIIRATQADMLAFAAQAEDAKKQQGDMKRIWGAFNRSQTRLSKIYPGQVSIKDDGGYFSSLMKLQLNQQMIDESIHFVGMGPKLQSLLQSYFDTRLSERAEADS